LGATHELAGVDEPKLRHQFAGDARLSIRSPVLQGPGQEKPVLEVRPHRIWRADGIQTKRVHLSKGIVLQIHEVTQQQRDREDIEVTSALAALVVLEAEAATRSELVRSRRGVCQIP